MNSLPTDPSCAVPTKIWKTSPDPSSMPSHKNSIPCHVFQTVDFHGPCEQEDRRNSAPESILLVPPSWTKQLMPAIPICRYVMLLVVVGSLMVWCPIPCVVIPRECFPGQILLQSRAMCLGTAKVNGSPIHYDCEGWKIWVWKKHCWSDSSDPHHAKNSH